MAIKDVLIPELQNRFPEMEMKFNPSSDLFVTIQAVHPQVGDLEIWDEGTEVTVGIKNITHSHFDCWDSDNSPEHIANYVSASVLEFLSELFNDRILFWIAHNGRSAGCMNYDKNAPSLRTNAKNYVWSGPLE